MLNTIEDITFIRQIETAILNYCKEVHELDYVEHGTDNIVAIVNREFVFRFPRNETMARRLVFETALLQKIKNRIDVVPTPEIIEVHTQPLYIVTKYIAGDHLTPAAIRGLSENEQVAIGKKIAEFVHQLNQVISGLEVRTLRAQASVEDIDDPWDIYFKRLFDRSWLPNDKLRPIVDKYYTLWRDYTKNEQKTYAIHDDLHANNLLFTGPNLTGIVDFGDTNTGSIESELRSLYGMGDTVLKTVIDHFQALSGTAIDYDHVRVWAIMHELGRFTDRLERQQTDTIVFKRAHQNLLEWVADFPFKEQESIRSQW